MDRVGDTLTAAFTRTNTDLRALGDTMKYAGPVTANLGISLEQASVMAEMLANNGLRGPVQHCVQAFPAMPLRQKSRLTH